MTSEAADIAAYIGALAWAPQIVSWIWRAASRPKLRVRAANNIQVGQTGLGAAIALHVAVSSDRKDALIDEVSALVIHERGDRQCFAWNRAVENYSEMTNDSGERVQVSRAQAVLALKVSTQALAERYVGFVQDAEQRAILASQNAAINEHGAQHANGEVDWDAFVRGPLAQAVKVETERAFHWQEGRYTLELRLSVVSGGKHVERFEFNLTRDNVEHIKANLSRWADNLSAVISGGPWLNWNSAFPTLTRS